MLTVILVLAGTALGFALGFTRGYALRRAEHRTELRTIADALSDMCSAPDPDHMTALWDRVMVMEESHR